MIGNFGVALNFNRLFSNSTGSSVTNYRFSHIIGVDTLHITTHFLRPYFLIQNSLFNTTTTLNNATFRIFVLS